MRRRGRRALQLSSGRLKCGISPGVDRRPILPRNAAVPFVLAAWLLTLSHRNEEKVCETKARRKKKPKCASKTKENITKQKCESTRYHRAALSIWESTISPAMRSTFAVRRNQRKIRIQTMYAAKNVCTRKEMHSNVNPQGHMSVCDRRREGRASPLIARHKKTVFMLSVISTPYTPPPPPPSWLDTSTFLPGTFSPSPNINQQALFPETRNSLSKKKPSNTCSRERPARTRVQKKNSYRLKRGLVVHWTGNLSSILLKYRRSVQHRRSLVRNL